MNYKIIDNFLDNKNFFDIKKTFFPKNKTQNKLPWHYNQGIVRDPKLGPTGYEKHDWMYSHSFLSNNCKKESDYIHLIQPIFKKLNATLIIDARANLLIPTENHIHHEDHVDRNIFHKVALFYVTTNNGFTVLKDVANINCVQNRMVIFDGSIYHHSVTSTDDVRCVININFIPHFEFKNMNFIYT